MATKSGGNCYQVNGNFIIDKIGDIDEDLYKLCHGVAILVSDGLPFGHCWIEYNDTEVIDYSNGNNYRGPKKVYYRAGKIPVAGFSKILKYTPAEVRNKILKTYNWGPWDYDPPR